MTIEELQALSTVADMLIELARGTPPCDFCKQYKYNKKILTFEGRKTKYCPLCGRKFKEAEE